MIRSSIDRGRPVIARQDLCLWEEDQTIAGFTTTSENDPISYIYRGPRTASVSSFRD